MGLYLVLHMIHVQLSSTPVQSSSYFYCYEYSSFSRNSYFSNSNFYFFYSPRLADLEEESSDEEQDQTVGESVTKYLPKPLDSRKSVSF